MNNLENSAPMFIHVVSYGRSVGVPLFSLLQPQHSNVVKASFSLRATHWHIFVVISGIFYNRSLKNKKLT